MTITNLSPADLAQEVVQVEGSTISLHPDPITPPPPHTPHPTQERVWHSTYLENQALQTVYTRIV